MFDIDNQKIIIVLLKNFLKTFRTPLVSLIHLPYIHKPLTVLLNNIVLMVLTEFVISDKLTLYS